MTLSDRWLIHRHIARQTDERLAIVTRTPQHILLVGADADESRSLLAARYPKPRLANTIRVPIFCKLRRPGVKAGCWPSWPEKPSPNTGKRWKPRCRRPAAICCGRTSA